MTAAEWLGSATPSGRWRRRISCAWSSTSLTRARSSRLQEWLGAFPDSTLVTESVEATENRVFALVRQEMRGAGSDVPVTFHYAALIGFRDGRATESEFHTDLPGARARFAALTAAAPRR